MDWTNIGMSTALPLILVWLFRNWISERLKRSIQSEYDILLEKHKAELKRDNDVYLAQLKAEHDKSMQLMNHNLELARLEHQTKFAGSFNEVIQTVKSTHAKLLEIHRALLAYTNILEFNTDPPKEERRKRIADIIKEFWEQYSPQRIFIPEQLDKEIVKYIKDVSKITVTFMNSLESGLTSVSNKKFPDHEEWVKIYDEATDQWNTVLASIRHQFRSIIGINENVNDTNEQDDKE